jgi:L-threonylcarbamoyladenylate synthase
LINNIRIYFQVQNRENGAPPLGLIRFTLITTSAMHPSNLFASETLTQAGHASRLLLPTDSAIKHAVAILNAGGLIALPTETVYGLGADAGNDAAVTAVFAAKGRPADHPLIVHLASSDMMGDYAREIPESAWRLARRFWPGPLTLILKRRAGVSDLVTGGQDTVGLRVPAHPVAQRLLQAFGRGIAAPSANRFGRISPTRADHVLAELGERVDCILDGGACTVGLESTILDLSGEEPRLLRPGGISADILTRELGMPPGRAATGAPRVSGSLPSHYAPRTPLQLLDVGDLETMQLPPSVAVMALRAPGEKQRSVRWLRMPEVVAEYSRQLFACLRDLDAEGHVRIYIERPPAEADWEAVHDRLTRAAKPPADDLDKEQRR